MKDNKINNSFKEKDYKSTKAMHADNYIDRLEDEMNEIVSSVVFNEIYPPNSTTRQKEKKAKHEKK